MQGAGALDRVELALQPGDALADQPAVDFELAFAGAAEKAEAAALAFEMGPGAHQPRALIGQRRQFDLQAALMGARPRAEDLEDQPGAVDDLGLPAFFEIALLHRRQRAIDDDEPDLVLADQLAKIVDGAAAEQAARARPRNARFRRARHRDGSPAPGRPPPPGALRANGPGVSATPRPGADFGAGWMTSARPVELPSAER